MRSQFSSVLFVMVILVSSVLASTTLSVNNSGFVTGPPIGKWFDYVVVIMMENHSINDTYGTSVLPNSWNSTSKTCLGNCTFFDSLANSNALAEGYTDGHIMGASLGDYIAVTSGYNQTAPACNSNPPGSGGCPLLQIPNIVDRLESARLSWKAYMEGYPQASGCYNNDKPNPYNYVFFHNPFIFYSDIQNNATRCSHIVNANTQPVSQRSCWPTPIPNDDLFVNDLSSPSTASNYMFLIPNTVDDVHDCNDISAGNAWLNRMVPQILNSAVFKTKRAALFITFDEDSCTFMGCPSTGPQLYTVWASSPSNPTTKVGFKSTTSYTHYNSLRTVEDNWSLPPLIASTDGSAINMKEFFP
jgi:Phosphoesterase family